MDNKYNDIINQLKHSQHNTPDELFTKISATISKKKSTSFFNTNIFLKYKLGFIGILFIIGTTILMNFQASKKMDIYLNNLYFSNASYELSIDSI